MLLRLVVCVGVGCVIFVLLRTIQLDLCISASVALCCVVVGALVGKKVK